MRRQHELWTTLVVREAWEQRRRWDETADARLDWLREESGLELRDDPAAITALWDWLLRWAVEPTGFDRSPAPVWWVLPVVDVQAYRRQVGIEAICAHLERVCWQRFPELVASVTVAPWGTRECARPRVGLGFTSHSGRGLAWPTSDTVQAAHELLLWDVPESRKQQWCATWFGDIDLWVESSRRARG